MTRAMVLRFWSRKQIRQRESAFAQNWRKNSRGCGGAFTSRALVGKQTWRCKQRFGPNARVLPKLDRADVILALDSDFLDCGRGRS